MTELLVIMAKMLPEEIIIDQLREALEGYKTGDKASKDKLAYTCILIATRFGSEEKDAMEMAKEMSENRQLISAFRQKS